MKTRDHLYLALEKAILVVKIRVLFSLLGNDDVRCRLKFWRFSRKIARLPISFSWQVTNASHPLLETVCFFLLNDEASLVEKHKQRSSREKENVSVLAAGGHLFFVVKVY